MTSIAFADLREINRRALIADLGATLAEEAEFLQHAEIVSDAMPYELAWAIHREGWIVEPTGGDAANECARRYGQGRRRPRIVAIYLREAAAAMRFAPSLAVNPHEWATVAMMNVGSIAYTREGEATGSNRRPSFGSLEKRDRGCLAIARRGASRCVVCGAKVDPLPARGAVIMRDHRPFTCSRETCERDERRAKDAMARVFGATDWLLQEVLPLRLDFLEQVMPSA